MEVLAHEHPLSVVDLQPIYPQYEEKYDDDDLVTKEDFRRQCDWCNKEIKLFHRYYYKCAHSCNYSLHKFCAELPITIKHASHSMHTLILFQWENEMWCCDKCGRSHKNTMLGYHCSECHFDIDVNCAMAWVEGRTIYHPSHEHPLVATLKPITCECSACGKKHTGVFYICSTCVIYFIHSDCVLMPETLMIHQVTKDMFFHTHPLTLSYSFPRAYQKAKFDPSCRLCHSPFHDENLWIYKCEKCMYYAHFACARPGEEKYSNFRRYDPKWKNQNPSVPNLPFLDETHNILKHLFFSQTESGSYEVDVGKFHQHPLILVDVTKPTSSSSTSSNLLLCHDPMKKIELLCNGCLRPITSMPFYKCVQHCSFVLHEWCTQLPTKVSDCYDHEKHTLTFHKNVPNKFLSVFVCGACKLPCNGFVYSCVQCDYHIDVTCALIPITIAHEAHPGHLLWRSLTNKSTTCLLCLNKVSSKENLFGCNYCNVMMHAKCAFLLPGKISHRYDKHPMSLSYFPIENHSSDYFCEICEEELNPQSCFYHCHQCNWSIHSSCATFILKSETATSSYHRGGPYEFVNIKFGGNYNIKGHPHNLSFVQGIENDGQCTECGATLQYKMIFKCQDCKFAIDFECCERLSS